MICTLLSLNVILQNRNPKPIFYPGLMSSGTDYSCVVKPDIGKLICWGRNTSGEIDTPHAMRAEVYSVRAGQGYTCALTLQAYFKCWGRDDYGQSSIGEGYNHGVKNYTSGYDNTCVIKLSGELKCFGDNSYGAEVPLALSFGAAYIGSDRWHYCVIMKNGKVYCWGIALAVEMDARFNINHFNNLKFVKPFKNDPYVRSMTIGIQIIFAVTYTNQIIGYDFSKQNLISRDDLDSMFNKYDDVLYIEVNIYQMRGKLREIYTLINQNRELYCYDILKNSRIPVPTNFRLNTVSTGMGFNHMCAMNLTGTVLCWGENSYNQLELPHEIKNSYNNSIVKLGWDHKCAVKSVYYLYCIGNNTSGQLDIQDENKEGIRELATGFRNTCIKTFNYSILCYGRTKEGINDPPLPLDLDYVSLNSQDSNLNNIDYGVVQLSYSNRHACMITYTWLLQCWGWNNYGQTDIDVANDLHSMAQVQGHRAREHHIGIKLFLDTHYKVNVVQVSTGGAHTCYIYNIKHYNNHNIYNFNSNNDIFNNFNFIWLNNTKININTNDDINIPKLTCIGLNHSGQTTIPVSSLDNIYHVSAGYKHTCSIINDPDRINQQSVDFIMLCWGRHFVTFKINESKLRQYFRYDFAIDEKKYEDINPIHIIINPQAISTGWNHTLIKSNSNEAFCFGKNNQDQCKVPKNVGLVRAIEANWDASCVINQLGKIICWGKQR